RRSAGAERAASLGRSSYRPVTTRVPRGSLLPRGRCRGDEAANWCVTPSDYVARRRRNRRRYPMTAVDESLVRSPLSPPPDLPGGTDPGGTRVHDIDARRWRLPRERAARSGVGTDALVAAVFADTLRLWAKGPEFSLACRIADGPGGFVEIPSAGLSFADRAGALHAALDTVEPAPAEVERPFLVGPDASATGRVRLACAYDTTADGLRLRWEAAADAFPSG